MSLGFSPPDITEDEINEVIDTLKSGWITTGPKTKQLENMVSEYTDSQGAVCLNSATAAMEMVLRLFEIGPGDEVITTAYTYSATAAVIVHVGATPVLVDVADGDFSISTEEILRKITPRTKAIIPVDIAGKPCDYDEIFKIVESNTLFTPKEGSLQEELGRVLVLADGAHSIGGVYRGRMLGSVADFTSFSFHAVKNITTAEGGVITWSLPGIDGDEIYKKLKTLSLHGQNKDAFQKSRAGSWEYDILYPGYKCNMTDIAASLGIVQLKRYKAELLARREEIFMKYLNKLDGLDGIILPGREEAGTKGTFHLFQIRIAGASEEKRNRIIEDLAKLGIPTNVHYKPLPLLTAYKNLGFSIEDYPNAYNMYKNQITLPLHTLLTDDDIDNVVDGVRSVIGYLVTQS